MGGACSANGGEERRIQGIGWDTCEKETPWEMSRRSEDIIKMDLQEVGCGGVWNGSSWLRIGTVGGHM